MKGSLSFKSCLFGRILFVLTNEGCKKVLRMKRTMKVVMMMRLKDDNNACDDDDGNDSGAADDHHE